MSSPENSSSEPGESLGTHPVLGLAQYQCAKCGSLLEPKMRSPGNFVLVFYAHCSRCEVYVDLPVMKADCAIIPKPDAV
jgi:hypothetical protein